MFERLKQMLIKEFIQVARDPRMKVVIFVIPCVQVFVIGYAVSNDVQHVPTAIYDLDNSVESRELTARFIRSGYFDRTETVDGDDRARYLLDHGDVSIVLRFNHGFAQELRGGRTAPLQIIVDGTDSNTAMIAASYATVIAGDYSQQVLVQRTENANGRGLTANSRELTAPGKTGTADLRIRAWFNENLEARNFFVPAVIVVVVGLSTLLLTSMAVVREKEIGTMEQIMVTPITPAEFILGKTLPFAVIGFIEVSLVTLIGVFWFLVPIRGDLLLLALGTALFLMNTLGMGLLISTFSETQQQAMMTTFLVFFPMMLLSGFVFPIANMPEAVQWLTIVNPIRYFMVIVRSIFLKGVGLDVLWTEMLPLLLMGVALLFFAVRRFHKTL